MSYIIEFKVHDDLAEIKIIGIWPIGSASNSIAQSVIKIINESNKPLKRLILDCSLCDYKWGDAPAVIVVECASRKINVDIIAGDNSLASLVELMKHTGFPSEMYKISHKVMNAAQQVDAPEPMTLGSITRDL